MFNLESSARSVLHEKQGRLSVVRSGTPGRPAFHICKEQPEMLLKARLSVPCVAELLYVSSRTIERRMLEYGLSVRAFYAEIQDCQLDDIETQKEETLKCTESLYSCIRRSIEIRQFLSALAAS